MSSHSAARRWLAPLTALVLTPALAAGATPPPDWRLRPTAALVSVLADPTASGSDTVAALDALAARPGEATAHLPVVLALLHEPIRPDCSDNECLSQNPIRSILAVLAVTGQGGAGPAVGELVGLLAVDRWASLPARPSPADFCHTGGCVQPVLATLRAIGPGAVSAVPALTRLAAEQATHPGLNDYRADLFATLEAIGPAAAAAVPLLTTQPVEPGSGGLDIAAVLALSRIAPDDPAAFRLIARAAVRPRSLRGFNSGSLDGAAIAFARTRPLSPAALRVLVDEIDRALADPDQRADLFLARWDLIGPAVAARPDQAAVTAPALAGVLAAYSANGMVKGSDAVIAALAVLGPGAAAAVPALAEKALTSSGAVYREEAVAALKAIGTPEAQAALADYQAGRWRP